MFRVQRHFENDNGNDIVWLFENEQNAMACFQARIDAYEKMTALPPWVEDYKCGNKRYVSATFKNSDESYTRYSLDEIEFSD